MKKLSTMFVLFLVLLFSVMTENQSKAEDYVPRYLSQKVESGEYQQKVNNFLIIFDASSSMFLDYKKEMKFKKAKRIVDDMNHTIPALDLQVGIRIFGPIDLAKDSKLQYGMTQYTKKGVAKTMDSIKSAGGGTPQSKSLRVAVSDLADTQGKTAVIIVSDAEDVGKTTVKAAKTLKETYQDDVCIYPILIGDLPRGKIVMEQIAQAGGCGFATDFVALDSTRDMAGFVEKVFLEKVPDSDGDGVLDTSDQCPDTLAGTAVDSKGCPLDSDGDGVLDAKDNCPGTPLGLKVDEKGCPLPIPPKETVTIELHMEFSFDKSSIRPKYNKHLENFANFLTSYKGTTAVLAGHTDNLGPYQYNMDLSLLRAESVKNYLIDKYNITENRLATKGYGPDQPITTNDTKIGRQRNRRVSAIVSAVK